MVQGVERWRWMNRVTTVVFVDIFDNFTQIWHVFGCGIAWCFEMFWIITIYGFMNIQLQSTQLAQPVDWIHLGKSHCQLFIGLTAMRLAGESVELWYLGRHVWVSFPGCPRGVKSRNVESFDGGNSLADKAQEIYWVLLEKKVHFSAKTFRDWLTKFS